MIHPISYRLRLKSDTEIPSFRKIHNALSDLCPCIESLDQLMAAELGCSTITVQYKTPTGNISDVLLCLSSDQPLTKKTFDNVHEYLSSSRRMILESLPRLKSAEAFNALYKKLIKLEKNFDDETFRQLSPTLSLNKKSLAHIIVDMSHITIGRANSPYLIYEDSHGPIEFSCENPIAMETLLGPIKNDDTIYHGKFSIKRAPGRINTPFDLMIDGRRVRHTITDEIFWKDWQSGEHVFVCFSTLSAKYKIHKTHDSTIYEIIKVEEILPPRHTEKQEKLVGIY